jgi:hypothetical protein
MKKLAALIIENRKFDNFGEICKQHLAKLPTDTELFVFTTENLVDEYRKQLSEIPNKVYFGNFKSNIPHPTSFNTIDGFTDFINSSPHLKEVLNYCMFMTQSQFWRTFLEYEKILTFQLDTLIFKDNIEDFMEWDYIGAPCYNFYNGQTIQNGGLSLRNPRTMEYICRYHGWESDLEDLIQLGKYSTANFFAEDIFFCLRMIKYGIGNYATLEASKRFSVESKLEWGTFGGHRLEVYHPLETVNKLKNQI